MLGAQHPETLGCMNNVAELYRRQKQYAEAESLFNELLAVRRRVLAAGQRSGGFSAGAATAAGPAIMRATLRRSRRSRSIVSSATGLSTSTEAFRFLSAPLTARFAIP